MPDPNYFFVADQLSGLLGLLADAADQAIVVAQAAGQAVDAGTGEALGGDFDALTGEPVNSGTISAQDGLSGTAAQPGPGQPGPGQPGGPRQPSFFEALFANPLLLFGGLMLLLYVMVLAPERRKQADIAKKRSALKKNDRVVTTGGILGTVVSVSPDSEEVTLKVDESTNTRIRILKSAIGSVLDPGKDKDKSEASG